MDLIELKKVEILLSEHKIKYQNNETIIGTVNIKLKGKLDLSRVNISLRSIFEVKWVEIYGILYYNKDGHAYRNIEPHLNVVYEIPDNIRNTVVTAGEHSIPFEFKLQDNIPSSFETQDGSIKYWIEVIINNDRSSDQQLYCEKKYLSIESPLRHGIHISVGGGIEKEFGILSLASGKVRIDAFLKRKGYIPGETVELYCVVTNASTVSVTPRASFYQTQTYMSKERRTTLEEFWGPVIGEKVLAAETSEQIISVDLPTDVSLSMKTAMISIKYFIHVTLDIPHALDLHLNLPIIITNEYAFND